MRVTVHGRRREMGLGGVAEVSLADARDMATDARKLDARPHGFRASLRTWLSDATDANHDAAEACIAHLKVSRVVDAYRRTDFLEQRAVLMQRWSDHVTGGSGQVLRLAVDG